MQKVYFLAVVVTLCGIGHAQTLDEVLEKVGAPGVSVFAARGERVIVDEAAGFANLEHRVRMRKESVHELASVSKQFTAAAILLLVQEGKLSLDDPLTKFYPDAHEDWKKITILHLLHHTSGLPDYLTELRFLTREWSNAQMVESIKKKPLEYEPGSKWEYSNSGYMVLGVIIETVSGNTAKEFYSERFWKPLQMNRTFLNDSREIIRDRADGYDMGDEGLLREDYTSRSLSSRGDGHIMSTTRDLWTWCRALYSNKVLDDKHLKIMLTPSKSSITEVGEEKHGYACGLVTTQRADGVTFYSHEGGWAGTSTYMVYNPHNQMFFAALANLSRADLNPFADYLVAQVQKS